VIGELWIEYGFTMIRRLQQPGALSGGVAHFSGTTPTTANNFATAVLQPGNTLAGITLGVNTVTWPAGMPGNYLMLMDISGATSATALGFTPSAGAANLALATTNNTRDDVAQIQSGNGGANVPAVGFITVSVANTGGLVTVTPGTLVGGDGMDLWIFALPSTILTVDEQEQVEIGDLKARLVAQDVRMARLEAALLSLSSNEEEHKVSDSPVLVPVSSSVRRSFHF